MYFGHQMAQTPTAMSEWEYKIERATVVERWTSKRQAEEIAAFEGRLNELGGSRWEMISFETIPLTGAFSGNIKGYLYLAFFKRPRA
jgi:hypothetical protein